MAVRRLAIQLRFLRSLHHRLPVQRPHEKSMLGPAGFFTGISKESLDGMIDVVKDIEPETGYGAILRLSEIESAMRESRIRRHQNRVHLFAELVAASMCGPGSPYPEG